MRAHLVLGMLAVTAAVAGAQANDCGPGAPATTQANVRQNAARDACQQSVDVFQFMAPQLGVSLTGGNAVLGKGGTLGGLGHLSVGVRANVLRGDLPDVTAFPAPRTAENPSAQVLPSNKQILGLPVVDAAIGIFKGLPLGLTNVGGVDLLLNAAYVPTVGDVGDDIQVKPETNLKIGYGARVGLLQESLLVPGIAVTYISRDIPTTTITGTSTNVDINIGDASIKTKAWRLVASKSFIGLGLAVGYGQDKYDQSATFSGKAKNIPYTFLGISGTADQTFGPVVLQQNLTRSNMFADFSLNLPLIKLIAEVGQVSGGDVKFMTNTFSSGAADDSRTYGSVGVRLAW